MKNKIRIAVIVILAAVMVISGIKAVTIYMQLNAEKNVLETEREKNDMRQKTEEPFKAEGDMIGWLKVDGTSIDYPVMHTPEYPEKYLHLDVNGEYSYSGTPFMDGSCSLDSDNMIIYGHNMLNKSMFSTLSKFETKEFWEEHKTIEFETEDGKAQYRVIAAIKTDVVKGEPLYSFISGTDEQYKSYLNLIRSMALYDTGFTDSRRQLILLSTCSYHTEDGRFIVIGKKKKD